MEGLQALVGKTATQILTGEDWIDMGFSDGTRARFFHAQDCCESVVVDDVNGDWEDLIGTPLLVAEERVSHDEPDLPPGDESNTWTFYTFRSVKGSVDVRWHGSSNGYYSEAVSLYIAAPNPSPAPHGAGPKQKG